MTFTRDWSCPGARWVELYWTPGDDLCRVRYYTYPRNRTEPIPIRSTQLESRDFPMVDAPVWTESSVRSWAAAHLAEHFAVTDAQIDDAVLTAGAAPIGVWKLEDLPRAMHE